MKKQAMNPYLPGFEHVPDGEPYVFGDRVYVYGSHDAFQGGDFCQLDYVGWSAPVDDLGNWRYEGVIYKKTKDPYYREGKNLFAPDVQQGPDGRYYLYYAFDIEGVIGVAVCDTPAGEYEYYGHVHYPDGTLLGRKGEPFQYDPGVLVDGDRVFLYTGFCIDMERIPRFRGLTPNKLGGMVTELEPDMVTVKESYKFMVPSSFNSEGTGYEGHAFFEAPSMRKVGDKYVFIYSSEQGHELCYAVSDYPDHGFRFGGTLVSNGDLGYRGNTKPMNYTGTNHGSIECINGKWYVFYHRQTGGSPYGRQGCAEPIEIIMEKKADSTTKLIIPQVPITSSGLNVAPLAGKGSYEAGIACCLMSGQGACAYAPMTRIDDSHPYFYHEGGDLDPETLGLEKAFALGKMQIVNMKSGAKAGYRYFDLSETQEIRISLQANGKGTLILTDDMEGGNVLGKADVQGAGAENVCISIHLAMESHTSGKSELWITYEGEGAIDLHNIEFC